MISSSERCARTIRPSECPGWDLQPSGHPDGRMVQVLPMAILDDQSASEVAKSTWASVLRRRVRRQNLTCSSSHDILPHLRLSSRMACRRPQNSSSVPCEWPHRSPEPLHPNLTGGPVLIAAASVGAGSVPRDPSGRAPSQSLGRVRGLGRAQSAGAQVFQVTSVTS